MNQQKQFLSSRNNRRGCVCLLLWLISNALVLERRRIIVKDKGTAPIPIKRSNKPMTVRLPDGDDGCCCSTLLRCSWCWQEECCLIGGGVTESISSQSSSCKRLLFCIHVSELVPVKVAEKFEWDTSWNRAALFQMLALCLLSLAQ